MPAPIRAPFTDTQVLIFNAWQSAGGPDSLLCPVHRRTGYLIATTDQLYCPWPDCDYVQTTFQGNGAMPK